VMAYLVGYFNRNVLEGLFAVFLLYSSFMILSKRGKMESEEDSSPALSGEVAIPPYEPKRYPLGLGASLVAGGLSGLLGIGGGPIKVPVMYIFMNVPLMVATATSNFMIGVTAAASAGIYLHRGLIAPGLAFPVMLGVLSGSLIGARYLVHAHVSVLRIVFTFVILALGLEMIINGVTKWF